MKEKYLAKDLEPLKVIDNGNLFSRINDFISGLKKRSKNVEFVAYEIRNIGTIISIYCLLKNDNGLFFRSFNYYDSTKNLDDELMMSANYGVGIIDQDMDSFFELRKFYQESLATLKAE